jgi:hypothetical protein
LHGITPKRFVSTKLGVTTPAAEQSTEAYTFAVQLGTRECVQERQGESEKRGKRDPPDFLEAGDIDIFKHGLNGGQSEQEQRRESIWMSWIAFRQSQLRGVE